MKTVDYHHFTLEDAITDAHGQVGMGRAQKLTSSRPIEIEFITGHGIIRHELVKLLQKYGLTPRTKLGNTGCIIVEIE